MGGIWKGKSRSIFDHWWGPNQHFQTQNGHTFENCACLSPTVGEVLYSLARTDYIKMSMKDLKQILKRVYPLIWYSETLEKLSKIFGMPYTLIFAYQWVKSHTNSRGYDMA